MCNGHRSQEGDAGVSDLQQIPSAVSIQRTGMLF